MDGVGQAYSVLPISPLDLCLLSYHVVCERGKGGLVAVVLGDAFHILGDARNQ